VDRLIDRSAVISPLNAVRSNRAGHARSALMNTIRQLPMNAHFSRGALNAANALALHAQEWRKPLAWFRPDGSPADALQCEMVEAQGISRLVSVYLYPLFGRTMVDSTCTCAQPLCPHAAALLIRLQQLLDWPRAMTPLQRWRQSIETITELASQSPSADSCEPRQVICLLRADGDRQPSALAARLVLVGASDQLNQPKHWLPAESAEAHLHLSPQAMLWQARLAVGPRCQRSNEPGFLLQGRAGAALLAEWLQAGICCHPESLQRIRHSIARQPQWQWSHDSHAQARIALQIFPGSTVQLIELDGLHYLDESSGEFGKLELSPETWSILEHMPPIPPGEAELLADWPPHPLLAGIPSPPKPPTLRYVRAALKPTLVIGACRHAGRGDFVYYLRAWADYDGCRLPLADEPWRQRIIRRVLDEYVTIEREIDREMSAWNVLEGTDIVSLAKLLPDAARTLVPPPDVQALAQRQFYRGGAETFAALDAVVQSLTQAGFGVEYDPDLPFAVLPQETQLRATLSHTERLGWTQFELAATLDDGEVNMLPIILHGIAHKAFSLTRTPNESPDAYWLAPIGAERFLPLPLSRLREWLAPLVECLDKPNKDNHPHLKLSRSQVIALSDCLQEQGVAIGGAAALNVADTLALLRAAQKSTSLAVVPTSFRGTLRSYQCEGLQWLQALRRSRLGGVLADDMGLGKTVQVIAHLLLEQEAGRLDRPALVVAPTSLVFNWMDEITRFAPTLRCVNFTGPERAARREHLSRAQVIITSYTLLVTELSELEDIDYSMLVLDEAQWIKNPLTQTARAVRCLRASHRLAVTGTPLENHLGELWAHVDAVMPGFLGDYRSFNQSFRIPIERHEDDRRMAILRQRIAPFLLRRSKANVAPELPPKSETVLRVAMNEGQRRLYESLRLSLSEQVREALASYSAERSHIVVLSALLRLRQVCCDPRLLGAKGDPPGSAKLDALLTLVRSLRDEGRQILVFSQFTSMLALIAQALRAERLDYVMLTGTTADRRTPVRRFQSGESRILLASLKAGGVGLNLTAADAVIHYDPWWNPAVERQAIDRAHRLGRGQPVFVYKLLCDDTIEEKIEAMKDRKSDLADLTLGDLHSPSKRLSELDVRALFALPSPSK
jgi:superfamily II DNA or RNA helicase